MPPPPPHDDQGSLYLIPSTVVPEKGDPSASNGRFIRQQTIDVLIQAKDSPRPSPPEDGANIFSKLIFHWIGGVLRNGYKRPLNPNDIPHIHPARSAHHGLSDAVQTRLYSNRARGDKFPLWWALYATFKREFWIGGACRGVADVLLVTTPYTLRYLIQFTMDAHAAGLGGDAGPPVARGIGLLVGIAAMLLVQTMAHNHFMFLLGTIGGQSRAVLVSAIFDKAMRISGRGSPDDVSEPGKGEKGRKGGDGKGGDGKDADGKEHTLGGLTNFMSVDCARIDRSTTAIHMLWTAPLSLIIAIALLIANLGVSALAGLALLVVGFGVLITAVGILFTQRKAIDTITASRVSLIHEVLGAVQLVKYLAWEDGFVRRIASIRARETRRLHAFQAVRNVVAAVSQALPIATAMVSFITYAKITHEGLSPAAVFSSVALFASLRMPLVYLPLCLQGCSDSWAALLRVQGYLGAEEPEGLGFDPGLGAALQVRDAAFVWRSGSAVTAATAATVAPPDNQEEPQTPVDGVSVRLFPDDEQEDTHDADRQTKSDFQLERLNFDLHRGELVGVIGSVGAGKTSLLSAVMGDMTKVSGSVTWGSHYAICAQQAWVYNATVRDNIIFGQPFNGERYHDVLQACSLERDMDLLPYGDSTVVGERGVVLSGGQKQRISLARAMYSQAQVLLLDDSLSAVDANVGRDIFDKAICGELAVSRTRVLCTHDTRVLPRCHRVLWMEQGRVRGFDSYESLMVREPEFARLVERQEAEKEAARKKKAEKGVGDDDDEIHEDRDDNPRSHARKPKKKDSEEDNLMQEEERAVRSVPWSVYTSFVKWSNSFVLVACVFPVLILAQGGTVLASLWLAWWSSQRFEELTTDEYIAIYISLAAAQAIFTYLFGFILATCCTRSSQAMMRKAVVSVLHAPMSFFDSTPLGRLTNRFSTDVEVTDYSLTEALRMFLTSLSGVAAIFAIIIVYFHWFAIPAGVLVLFLGFLAYYYRTTAREVKRLESTLRSAVFARFIEGLKGAATIRTYGLDVRFGRELRQALDDVNSASFTTYAVQRWLGLRQDAAVVLVVAIMGALVLVDRYRQHPSIAGLVLSLMLNAVQVIQVVVREWADVEGSMNAVERLYEYAVQLPQEEPGRHDDDNNDDDDDDDDITNTKPNPNHPPTSTSTSIQLRPSHTWLRTGSVHFTDVHLHYRPGIPPSLRGVTLHIRAGEHAAIVGRTGAGKSSIINALFRMTEISSGRITIDDTDTATLPLAALRGALSIIPQDANLFAGSVRSNLDPFGALPDAQLWAGLRAAAGLHETLALADEVAHEGANLSQGQRQLLALARVLVRGEANRVLVCDEATAALDAETDDRIQGVLREVFKGRTIICVAHRLRTVLWYDRVYVMDQGRVAEEGSPLELFRREGGLFREMCVKHGLTEEQVVEGANSGR